MGGDRENREWAEGLERVPAWRRLIEKYGLDYAEVQRDARLYRMLMDMFAVIHGRDNMADPHEIERPIEDPDAKRRDLFDYLAGGGEWAKAATVLGLSPNTQVRLLFNGHDSVVFAWGPDTLADFEQDVRAGMGERKLVKRYSGLHPSQARKLIAVFRGMA